MPSLDRISSSASLASASRVRVLAYMARDRLRDGWPAALGASSALGLSWLAAAAGHVGRIQLIGAALGVGLVLAARWFDGARGVRRVLDASHALSVLGLALALWQPEHRGTHRWLGVGGFDVPVALFASVCAPLQLALDPQRAWRRVSAAAALGLIVASSSFTLAAISACACAAVLGRDGRRVTAIVALGVMLALAALALGNPNRGRRIREFAAPAVRAPYQLTRARSALASLSWKSDRLALEPLPCAATDFALLDLGRRQGLGALAAWLLAQAGLLAALAHARARARGESASLTRAATGLVFASSVAHVGVNLTALPPAGTLAAFTGATGAGWLVSGFVFASLIGVRDVALTSRSPRPASRGSRWSASLALIGWACACGAFGWSAAAPSSRAAASRFEEPMLSGGEPRTELPAIPAQVVGSGVNDVDLLVDAGGHDAEIPSELAQLVLAVDVRRSLRRVRAWCACPLCASSVADSGLEHPAPLRVRIALMRERADGAPADRPADVRLPVERPAPFLAQDLMFHIDSRLQPTTQR